MTSFLLFLSGCLSPNFGHVIRQMRTVLNPTNHIDPTIKCDIGQQVLSSSTQLTNICENVDSQKGFSLKLCFQNNIMVFHCETKTAISILRCTRIIFQILLSNHSTLFLLPIHLKCTLIIVLLSFLKSRALQEWC